jgi:hypothetical protein
MFMYASACSQPIGKCNTAKVTDNTAAVTDMGNMILRRHRVQPADLGPSKRAREL